MSDTTPRDQLEQIIAKHIDCDVWGSKMDCGMDYPSPDYTQFGTTEHLADAIVNAGWRPPARVVETVEETEELPPGTVIRSALGTIAAHAGSNQWQAVGWTIPAPAESFTHPATVLWEPEEGAVE